jgi:thiol-disulfide isomerase/thioredoxin
MPSSGVRKIAIEDMQHLADKRGGKCLSKEYITATTKLLWKCKYGHTWLAMPSNIQQGKWCPTCGRIITANSRRLDIEEMKEIAKSRLGECLSIEYKNSGTLLLWKCQNGHTWWAVPSSVKGGSWCPYCAGTSKLTITEMQKIAEEREGQCLSGQYINANTKLRWQCKEGHVWDATPSKIKSDRWCPVCAIKKRADKERLTIEEMQRIAENREGLCLSKKYIDANTKLKWQCKEGHIWEATPGKIKWGRWCPHCAHNVRLNIEEMQELAKSRGGTCASDNYVNNRIKLQWQCKEGHIWKAEPSSIKQGTWCPYCAGVVKHTIEEVQKLAESKGGKCLSNEYIDANTKLKWQCKEGHIWETVPSSIQQGTWCPKCSEGISERICRKIFESIFNEKFPKRRPVWLISPQGNKMELDGYCNKLGVAFEYQGDQHYNYNRMFHKTRSFDQQKTYDELKRKKCEENSIHLIEIPYVIDYEKMPEYIVQECKKRNIEIPEITKSLDYKLMNIYSPEKLKDMQEQAKAKGGKCLSEKYIKNNAKLKWQCKEGHIWRAVPSSIKMGKWCPYCAGIVRLTIEEMQKIAKERGGKCLSEKYQGNHVKLKWQCKGGHIWENTPHKIKWGQWCPYCAGEVRLTIEEMQDIAKERDGKCLSNQYINVNTKLKWQCKEGHIWEAVPSSVKGGSWCPYCAHRVRLSIEEMQKLAESRGGKCLSDNYINNQTKLKWQCKEGHIWDAPPGHIKTGKWCPFCAHNARLTIEEMQRIAESRGGKCLSDNYINSQTKLKWQCKEGHVWEAIPNSIQRGTWCPTCAHKVPVSIQDMQKLAESRGGLCLSDEYIDAHSKLKWKCSNHHVWEANYSNVYQGTWCPICARNRKRNTAH